MIRFSATIFRLLGAPRAVPTVSADELSLAKQGVEKLTTDELHAIGAVYAGRSLWPGLVAICFKVGLDRPFALD